MALLVVGLLWVSGRQQQAVAPAPLPFTEPEKTYATRIHFTNIQMSRATNFLGHQITVIAGFMENAGTATVQEMEIAVEFRDFDGRVVLRDNVRFPGGREQPILGGRRRDFQFNFEKVPGSWNQQHPKFEITGLRLEP